MAPRPVRNGNLMFLDAHTLSNGEALEADVCIVGGGAAGIALAMELRNRPFKVLLLESGGFGFSHRAQLLYRGQSSGRAYPSLEFTHRRQFGGTMRTWFGRCRPLDEADFEARSYLPYSGWPFKRAELDACYARAHSYCELGRYDYDPNHWPEREGEQRRIQAAGLETKIFQFSPPTDFGRKYRGELARASNIQVCLHANALSLALDPSAARISHLRCKTSRGVPFAVRAHEYVLAAGALDVTRLLLDSNDGMTCGLGNQNDLVGRFFMEHPHLYSGVITGTPAGFSGDYFKLNHDFLQTGLHVVKALGLPAATMRAEGLGNASAFILQRPLHKAQDPYYSRDAVSAIRAAQVLQHAEEPSLRPFFSGAGIAGNARRLLSLSAGALTHRLRRAYRPVLRAQIESIPNPESRVMLSDKRDPLGNHRINLHWQLSRQDLESYCRFTSLLHAGLGRLGFEIRPIQHDLDTEGWPVSLTAAMHHLGTTRMHADPRQGVVDAEGRVHGLENLYIASGSVFPTSGMANPTLTIIALAIRLGDHLKRKLSAGAKFQGEFTSLCLPCADRRAAVVAGAPRSSTAC